MLKVPLGHVHDNDKCVIGLANDKREKTVKARKNLATRRTRDDKANLRNESTRHQLKLTQDVFNEMIRLLDANENCIACNKSDAEIPDIYTGGKFDCGHYKTRGAFPQLRFHAPNAFKQCKGCNGGSNYFSAKRETVNTQFEAGIVRRFGTDHLAHLKSHHPDRKWKPGELIEMRAVFAAEVARLKRGEPASRDWRSLTDTTNSNLIKSG